MKIPELDRLNTKVGDEVVVLQNNGFFSIRLKCYAPGEWYAMNMTGNWLIDNDYNLLIQKNTIILINGTIKELM